MKILSKLIFLTIIVAIIFSAYKISQEAEKQKNYEKCVSVCASVAEDNFDSLKICMDKCEEKFLEGKVSDKFI